MSTPVEVKVDATPTTGAVLPMPTNPTTATPPTTNLPTAMVPPAAGQPANASLYVGALGNEVTEAMLFEKFNAVGQVASIRVCRDAITRRSLSYAYVNFVNPADATTALETMNYDPIQGVPCRIMYSQRDPSVRRSGVGNIFIKNLDKDIDHQALYDTFKQFGKILSCKVVFDNTTGESRGFGFIHFETQKAADTAIEKVNNMVLGENQVFVGHFKSKVDRVDEMGKLEKEFTNLFIKNLKEELDEEALEKGFSKFGKITSCKIMTAEDGSKSKGFGFVAFDEAESARAAVEEYNGKNVKDLSKEDTELFVGRAQKKAERMQTLRSSYEKRRVENQNRYKGVNLYVKNLDDSITDDQLREAFTDFGTITSAKVMRDEKQSGKGFGFVCFTSQDEATKAVTEMNGKILVSKPLYVALAQRKEERKQQLAMQHNQRLQSLRMQAGMYQQPAGMQPMYMPQVMAAPQQNAQRGYYAQGGVRPQAYMQGGPQNPQRMVLQNPAGGFRAMPGGMQQPPRSNPRGGQPRQPKRAPNAGFNQQRQQQQQQPRGNMPMPVASPALHQAGQPPLTASALASANAAEQKQMLGERLFPLIQQTHSELAGKITGMLLEMDNSELLHLLEDVNALKLKVKEAVKVLDEHNKSLAGATA